MAETPAPIESVEVVVSESDPLEYSLRIVSGLPSGCVEFKGYEVSLDGNVFTVDVVNLEPTGPVVCTAIYETHEGEVALDGSLTPGETYTVIVNGEVTNSFLARNDRTREWVMELSPIENVEVVVSESDPSMLLPECDSRLCRRAAPARSSTGTISCAAPASPSRWRSPI